MQEARNALNAPERGRAGWRERFVSRLRVAPPRLPGIDGADSALDDVAVWEDWREYLDLITWLVPDVYRHAKARMLGLLLLSVIGVGARAATIGSMLLYINARTTGEELVFAGVTLPTEASVPVFLLWGAIAIGFTVITILTSYRADAVTFDVGQSYMEMAINRVLRHKAMGRTLDLPPDIDSRTTEPIALMLRGDTYRLVRVVVQTLGVLLPFITLIVAVCVLIFTNWLLTVILVPALLVYSLGLAVLNRGVMRDSQKRQFARQQLAVDVRAMLSTLEGTRYPVGGEPEWLGSYPHSSWLRQVMEAFRGIVLAKKRVAYLGDAFQGVALLLVLLVFGSLVADGATSWAVLLTYLMALGYATRSMGGVSRGITSANRFIPQVRRYVLFMQMNPESEGVPEISERPDEFWFKAEKKRIRGSVKWMEGRMGQVLWCVAQGRMDSSALGELCFALANGDPADALRIESEMFFLGRVSRLPERPIRSYLPPLKRDEVGVEARAREILEALGVRNEFEEKVGSFDRVFTVELAGTLSSDLLYALRLLPGALAESHLVILDLEPLDELGDDFRDRVLAVFSDRLVLLMPRWRRRELVPGVDGALVVDDGRIRGLGDASWYENAKWAWISPERESGDPVWSGPEDEDELDSLDDEA